MIRANAFLRRFYFLIPNLMKKIKIIMTIKPNDVFLILIHARKPAKNRFFCKHKPEIIPLKKGVAKQFQI